MADTAAAQLRRILHLIPRLADGKEHTRAEIAEVVGTEPVQLMRDLQSISERFDVPGGFVEQVSIFIEEDSVCVRAPQFRRPMRLTMPELCALELGLTMLKRERTPVEQGPIDRALDRLRQTITNVPSNDRHAGTRFAGLTEAASAESMSVLRTALAEDRRVELRYRSGGATESTTRTICPHSLAFAEQMWYLVATGEDGALRFFRLDRVENVTVLNETFERDAAVAMRLQESVRPFSSETTRRMKVRYSPRIARWVAEREGAPVAEDGSLTIEHAVADESWAVRHVLQYGPDAELLEPPELRALIAQRLSELS